MPGINRAENPSDIARAAKAKNILGPCVFISYRLADKEAAVATAAYIMQAECDVYCSELSSRSVLSSSGDKVATCILGSHPFGWELRLMTTDLLRSQVCRSSEEVLSTA
jgi:hypothetical protein